jgi:glycosyltransferase involved in cell wall biosynthesis
VDGRIVAPGDADALAAAIAALDDDRDLLASMSVAARKKAASFTLDSYAQQVNSEVLRRRPELGR